MLRLKLWTRVGLLALFVATSTALVTVAMAPPAAANPGAKSLEPSGDPSGGGMTSGDPDGPTGDISPAGGALYSGNGSSISGSYVSSTMGSSSVAAAKQPKRWFDWVQIKHALGDWLRRSILGY